MKVASRYWLLQRVHRQIYCGLHIKPFLHSSYCRRLMTLFFSSSDRINKYLPRPRMCDTLEELYNTILSRCTVSQPAVDWEKASVSGLPTLKNNVLPGSCLRGGRLRLFFVFCNVNDSTVSVVAEVWSAIIECFIKTCPPGNITAARKQTWKRGLGWLTEDQTFRRASSHTGANADAGKHDVEMFLLWAALEWAWLKHTRHVRGLRVVFFSSSQG